MGNESELKQQEKKLNKMKDSYQEASAVYNKKYSPLFMISHEIARLRAKMEADQSNDESANKKVSELEKKLTACEKDVQQLLKDLEKKMLEIAEMEQALYGKDAAKPDSPSILEKKDIYSKK